MGKLGDLSGLCSSQGCGDGVPGLPTSHLGKEALREQGLWLPSTMAAADVSPSPQLVALHAYW